MSLWSVGISAVVHLMGVIIIQLTFEMLEYFAISIRLFIPVGLGYCLALVGLC